MDWHRVLVVAAGAGGFIAPSERSVTVVDKGLLMESASTLKPFDSRADQPRPPAALPVPPVPVPAPVTAPQTTDLLAMLREDPQPTPAPNPSLTAIVPVAPPRAPHREAVRPIVAVTPRPLPEGRPPSVPAVPLIRPKPEPRSDGVLTPATIRQFRLSLRLTPDQEPYWFPVQQALNEIGAQQAAMVRAGQAPKEAVGVGAAMRIYSVARPLLDMLREDQKARVRAQARSLGFTAVASQI